MKCPTIRKNPTKLIDGAIGLIDITVILPDSNIRIPKLHPESRLRARDLQPMVRMLNTNLPEVRKLVRFKLRV
jgi:hypothetical protein